MAEYLVQHGADVNAQVEDYNCFDFRTPLHMAVTKRSAEWIRMLVHSKADVTVKASSSWQCYENKMPIELVDLYFLSEKVFEHMVTDFKQNNPTNVTAMENGRLKRMFQSAATKVVSAILDGSESGMHGIHNPLLGGSEMYETRVTRTLLKTLEKRTTAAESREKEEIQELLSNAAPLRKGIHIKVLRNDELGRQFIEIEGFLGRIIRVNSSGRTFDINVYGEIHMNVDEGYLEVDERASQEITYGDLAFMSCGADGNMPDHIKHLEGKKVRIVKEFGDGTFNVKRPKESPGPYDQRRAERDYIILIHRAKVLEPQNIGGTEDIPYNRCPDNYLEVLGLTPWLYRQKDFDAVLTIDNAYQRLKERWHPSLVPRERLAVAKVIFPVMTEAKKYLTNTAARDRHQKVLSGRFGKKFDKLQIAVYRHGNKTGIENKEELWRNFGNSLSADDESTEEVN